MKRIIGPLLMGPLVFGPALLALACGTALAAGTGELWEVHTQMNMPGMPAGMGSSTSQTCNATGDPSKQADNPATSKCKVTDSRQSGNKFTMTLDCPEGRAIIEHGYNAAHTEYKGSMKMTMRDGGEMTMAMTGRKIGSCDAEQANRQRDERIATAKRQGAQAQAQIAASENQQVQNCARAPESMDLGLLGTYGRCDLMQGTCEQMLKEPATKKVASACMASRAQLCKRYQTMDGFLKANGNEDIAQTCGLDRDTIAASHCPRAAKSENLGYLSRFCPDEAKAVAVQHCAGRSYTSAPQDKYTEFCSSQVARASLESAPSRSPAPRGEAPKPAQPQDAVTQGVQQGLNKLKGLFGR
jgi:hypothetical protein